jgi:hypothetical protein
MKTLTNKHLVPRGTSLLKKTIFPCILAGGACLAFGPLAHGNLLINGDFEATPGLSGWSNDDYTNGILQVIPAAQSPFTSGTQGLNIGKTGTGTGTNQPFATKALSTPISGSNSVNLSFDFWTASGGYSGSDSRLNVRLFTNTGKGATVSFLGTNAVSGAAETTQFSRNTWYHVNVNASPITPSGVATVTMTLTDQSSNVLNYTLDWTNVDSGNWVSVRVQPSFGDQTNINSYIDNISVIPEPATTTLLVAAGIGGIVMLRRRRVGRS